MGERRFDWDGTSLDFNLECPLECHNNPDGSIDTCPIHGSGGLLDQKAAQKRLEDK